MKMGVNGKGLGLAGWRTTGAQVAVILGALLVAAYIGYRPSGRMAQLPAAAGLGILLLILFSRYLPWALAALAPMAFLIDIKINTGTKVVFNVTYLFLVFVLATWLVRKVIFEKRLRLSPSPANLPALLFIAACLLGWVSSFLPWLPVAVVKPGALSQVGAFLLYSLSMGGLLIAADTWKDLRPIKFFTWTYLALGTAYIFAAVISRDWHVVNQWFVDALFGNSAFWTLLAALAAGQALFNRDLGWPLRGGLFVVVGLELGYLLLYRATWVSGWLPALIAVAVLVWLWDWRVGLALSTVGLLFIPGLIGFWDTGVNDADQQWSSYTRFATWSIVFKLILINPITGLGPAAYSFYTQYFNYLGVFYVFNTHNNYFDIALQTGLVGLAIFVWLIVVIFQQGWLARRRALDGFSRGYINAVLAALVAVLISGTFADWFLPYVYNIGVPGFQGSLFIWLFAGGLLAIANMQAKAMDVS